MIAYLKGTLHRKRDQQVILLTEGVGYLVSVNSSLLDRLPHEGEEISLFIYTAVRDHDIALFGFEKESELAFFQKLLLVSGVGAKTALSILNHPMERTMGAILSEDQAFLSSLTGIGKKLAARMILELKNKIDFPMEIALKSSPTTSSSEEAMQALLNLGYERAHVLQFIREQGSAQKTAEEFITTFLRSA